MIDSNRPRRSALYLPASNQRAIVKARGLDCDVVILDLEDAVAPEAKTQARDAAVVAAHDGGFGRRELVCRVNTLGSEEAEADLAAIADAPFDAVLVPKVSSPAEIDAVQAALSGAPPRLRIWAMIETCAAILALPTIAVRARQTRLTGFVIGTNDLAKELRCPLTDDRTYLVPLLMQALVAARAHGLLVLDGVYNRIDDDPGLAAQCAQAAAMGFDGKTLIHPRQIAPCNAAFTPSADAVAEAERIIAAFAAPEAQGKGAIRLDGAMVELLHLEQAQRTVALAEAAAEPI